MEKLAEAGRRWRRLLQPGGWSAKLSRATEVPTWSLNWVTTKPLQEFLNVWCESDRSVITEGRWRFFLAGCLPQHWNLFLTQAEVKEVFDLCLFYCHCVRHPLVHIKDTVVPLLSQNSGKLLHVYWRPYYLWLLLGHSADRDDLVVTSVTSCEKEEVSSGGKCCGKINASAQHSEKSFLPKIPNRKPRWGRQFQHILSTQKHVVRQLHIK